MAVALPLLLPTRAPAGWWKRAPVDFEECAEAAANAANKEDKTAALADCNAKFAGRRKPGGGYTYYDFMQDRSFDIAGPNPTPEEQKYIDQQYTLYLEKQRRSSTEAALSAKQQEEQLEQLQFDQPQPASLRTETERVPMTGRVPIPHARPSKLIAASSNPSANANNDARQRARDCAQHSFSCEWPRLSEKINDLKKFFGASPAKGKGS